MKPHKLVLCTAFLIVSSLAQAAFVTVMNGSHDVINGNRPWHMGLTGLGHHATLRPDSNAGWSAALAGGGPIIVEQRGADRADVAAVTNFVSNGGRLIVLGGFNHNSGQQLLDALFGVDSVYSGVFYGQTYAQTSNAAGTTFADDPAQLHAVSSSHPIVANPPPGAEVFYELAPGKPIVFGGTLGAGDIFHIGFDFYGGAPSRVNDWYQVLDSAITFGSGPAAQSLVVSPVPEPGVYITASSLLGIGLVALRRYPRSKRGERRR
ncbi:MAG: hypothetical protein ACFB21_13510 [Opitutales bacterium]